MADTIIACPSCGHHFPLDEAVGREKEAEFSKRLEAEKETMRAKAREWADQEALRRVQLAQREAAEKADAEKRFQAEELAAVRKREAEQRDQIVALMRSMQELRDKELAREVENVRKLDDERRKLAEESEKRQAALLEEKLRQAREDERKREEDAAKRLSEKDQQMAILQKTIADLQRQAAQGSQQAQGDALENALKDRLSRAFPLDGVEDVATGENGADLVHIVRDGLGRPAGTIVWEMKNTKAWTDKWLAKLKDDRARAKADVAVIVTAALPKGVTHFGQVEGLWVTEPAYAPMLASALREGLLSVAESRAANDGRETKMEAVYGYLSSPQFKSRIETVMDAFKTMKDDIDSERRAMTKHWASREKALERVLAGVGGLHGELQTLMGSALLRVEALELPDRAQ